jgi:glutathione S-transferase
MLKLHGFAVSNYANMVHLALLEKGIPFEYVQTYGDQTPEFLAKSPRGKIPYVQTPEGFINETNVILEYLEEVGTGTPLLPRDPFRRAQVRALMKEIELYVELPARSCYLEGVFGGKVADPIKDKARDDLTAGIATLARHAKFAPYVAGDEFTLADIMFLYSIEPAALVAQRLFGLNLLASLPGASELLQRLHARPHVQTLATRTAAEMPSFITAVRAKYGLDKA